MAKRKKDEWLHKSEVYAILKQAANDLNDRRGLTGADLLLISNYVICIRELIDATTTAADSDMVQ